MIASLQKIYKNACVLVTGHTGFKGSWLSLWLRLMGAKVVGYAIEPPSQPNLFEAAGLADDIIHIHGDIRDLEHLHRVLLEYKPTFVFHLAAQSLVRFSYLKPQLTYETNVLGTVNVLEAVRLSPSVRAVVNITSDKCYENREWVWGYRENDPIGGYDPYSSSKGAAELITSAYRRSYFAPETYGRDHNVALASVRAGNVIGGGDWGMDRLIPDCIRTLNKGEEIEIRHPGASRPWQHVLEPLLGYLMLGEKLFNHGPEFAEAWNFGPEDSETQTVSWMVEKVTQLWGPNARWKCQNGNNPHEAHFLKLDCSKAIMRLGWKPKLNLPQALAMTVSWYKTFQQKPGIAKKLTMEQIISYQNTGSHE